MTAEINAVERYVRGDCSHAESKAYQVGYLRGMVASKRWTTTAPTETGYYWVILPSIQGDGCEPEIARYNASLDMLMYEGREIPTEAVLYFLGPLKVLKP